jgi:hypothetical protein
MDRETKDKRLDGWLDQALAELGSAEPNPGMEARTVLYLRNRITRRSRLKTWRRTVWMSAAAVTIVVFLAVFLTKRDEPLAPDLTQGNDHELLLGIDRLLDHEIPPALEPALLLTKEMDKK